LAIQAAHETVFAASATGSSSAPPVAPEASAAPVADEALDFRFCYRRRRVGWPSLYDEMCAVASRGAYRGLGFAELAERGITFCLSDMPRLTALLEQVIAEEMTSPEPSVNPAPITLAVVPASS
jgi:hypothetical protein